MKHEVHSIIFKDEEGKQKYQRLVDEASSCEKNHAKSKDVLAYMETLVARLEAHDCLVDAKEKAYEAGNGSPYIYDADEILCEHWIHGDWLKEAEKRSVKCSNIVITISTIIGTIIAIISSPIWLPFAAIWATLLEISNRIPEKSHAQDVLTWIIIAASTAAIFIPGTVCSVIDGPIELLADYCQKRVNAKTFLPHL